MGKVSIFEKAEGFRHELESRGHHVVYRASETNRCPGCGRAQWYVGRVTAECVFCGTAIVLAEAQVTPVQASHLQTSSGRTYGTTPWDDARRHRRRSAKGRTAELLIDGSPHSFALENVSDGGAMGHDPVGLAEGTSLQVRLENGGLVTATVKWVEGDLLGLAFEGTGH